MATNKERLEDLETSQEMMQDELQKMNVAMVDLKGELEEKFTRLMEAVSNRDSGGSAGSRGSRRTDGNRAHAPGYRGEHENPFAAVDVPPERPRHVKLDFPRFSAGDPTEWVSKVNQYFDYQEVPVEQLVRFTSFHLDGVANRWWQATASGLRNDRISITWEVFERELWARFGPHEGENFHEALMQLRQTGSLNDYQEEFEKLQSNIHEWSQEALVGAFMGGLNHSISEGIRMFQPKSLREVINYARLRDGQLQRQRKEYRRPTTFPRTTTATPVSAIPENRSKKVQGQTPKKLSWDEFRRKRSLRLCFSCDERYAPGQKCRKPQLLLMEGGDEEEEEEELPDNPIEPEITLQALTGWDTPRTLRVHAVVNWQELVALIDSGSTHNFISEKAANRLNLKITAVKPFNVRVADGHPLRCRGSYQKVTMDLSGVSFVLEFFVLPLQGLDVVLGVQWLELLGPTLCDWKAHTMEFEWAGQKRMVRGLLYKPITQVQPEEISKEARMGQACFALTFQPENDAAPPQVPIEMSCLLQQFEEVFQVPSELPPSRDIEHHITLKEGVDPVNVRPYRYAHFQKAEIEKQVEEMLRSGLIQPSSSPFSSPVLLVKKKDGSWRFCTDYPALNSATVKDRFPIPTVDDMLDELHGAKFLTKLDLSAGYHQVRVHLPDVPKTAFRTHNGHYEYLVMPFGLCNAPSTFQSLMNSVFRSHLRKFVLVFFDDILVYSSSWEDHLEHVRVVFQILQQHKLFVKFKKCEFGKLELEYLGHFISGEGVKVDQSKIQAMLDWLAPTTITELRGFLGLTGYYRKFVKDYGIIARPLTNLLKKGKFEWNEIAESAFTLLKEAMMTTPTLAMPNFDAPFIIQTDASGDGIGAVLTQDGKPLAFMSRSLGVAKQSWSTYAREMLAIVIAIRTWRPYLLGRKFIIQTDQRSLRFLLEQRILTPEQQKWMGKLVGYDYEITYKPGTANAAADALSRKSGSPCLNNIFVPHTAVWEELKRLATTDPYLVKIGKLARTTPGQPYS